MGTPNKESFYRDLKSCSRSDNQYARSGVQIFGLIAVLDKRDESLHPSRLKKGILDSNIWDPITGQVQARF